MVTVSTKKIDGKVRITVKDNGTAYRLKFVIKSFNPFLLPSQPAREPAGLVIML
jgi:hypothetical protein